MAMSDSQSFQVSVSVDLPPERQSTSGPDTLGESLSPLHSTPRIRHRTGTLRPSDGGPPITAQPLISPSNQSNGLGASTTLDRSTMDGAAAFGAMAGGAKDKPKMIEATMVFPMKPFLVIPIFRSGASSSAARMRDHVTDVTWEELQVQSGVLGFTVLFPRIVDKRVNPAPVDLRGLLRVNGIPRAKDTVLPSHDVVLLNVLERRSMDHSKARYNINGVYCQPGKQAVVPSGDVLDMYYSGPMEDRDISVTILFGEEISRPFFSMLHLAQTTKFGNTSTSSDYIQRRTSLSVSQSELADSPKDRDLAGANSQQNASYLRKLLVSVSELPNRAQGEIFSYLYPTMRTGVISEFGDGDVRFLKWINLFPLVGVVKATLPLSVTTFFERTKATVVCPSSTSDETLQKLGLKGNYYSVRALCYLPSAQELGGPSPNNVEEEEDGDDMGISYFPPALGQTAEPESSGGSSDLKSREHSKVSGGDVHSFSGSMASFNAPAMAPGSVYFKTANRNGFCEPGSSIDPLMKESADNGDRIYSVKNVIGAQMSFFETPNAAAVCSERFSALHPDPFVMCIVRHSHATKSLEHTSKFIVATDATPQIRLENSELVDLNMSAAPVLSGTMSYDKSNALPDPHALQHTRNPSSMMDTIVLANFLQHVENNTIYLTQSQAPTDRAHSRFNPLKVEFLTRSGVQLLMGTAPGIPGLVRMSSAFPKLKSETDEAQNMWDSDFVKNHTEYHKLVNYYPCDVKVTPLKQDPSDTARHIVPDAPLNGSCEHQDPLHLASSTKIVPANDVFVKADLPMESVGYSLNINASLYNDPSALCTMNSFAASPNPSISDPAAENGMGSVSSLAELTKSPGHSDVATVARVCTRWCKYVVVMSSNRTFSLTITHDGKQIKAPIPSVVQNGGLGGSTIAGSSMLYTALQLPLADDGSLQHLSIGVDELSVLHEMNNPTHSTSIDGEEFYHDAHTLVANIYLVSDISLPAYFDIDKSSAGKKMLIRRRKTGGGSTSPSGNGAGAAVHLKSQLEK